MNTDTAAMKFWCQCIVLQCLIHVHVKSFIGTAGSHDLLVLIDQHAAHERVRVETLTSGMISEG